MFLSMQPLDLTRQAMDQIVAHPIVLHPVGEVDELGAESPPRVLNVNVRIGDTIVVMGERLGKVLAYQNYARPPTFGLPPYVFTKEEMERVLVEEQPQMHG